MPMFYVCCVCNTPVPFIAALRFNPDAEAFNWPLHRACQEFERRKWWTWREPLSEAEGAR
jgi:hypothetical protein